MLKINGKDMNTQHHQPFVNSRITVHIQIIHGMETLNTRQGSGAGDAPMEVITNAELVASEEQSQWWT